MKLVWIMAKVVYLRMSRYNLITCLFKIYKMEILHNMYVLIKNMKAMNGINDSVKLKHDLRHVNREPSFFYSDTESIKF